MFHILISHDSFCFFAKRYLSDLDSSETNVLQQRDTQDIVKMLAEQMVSPVLWELSMQQAISDGCTESGSCMNLKRNYETKPLI